MAAPAAQMGRAVALGVLLHCFLHPAQLPERLGLPDASGAALQLVVLAGFDGQEVDGCLLTCV